MHIARLKKEITLFTGDNAGQVFHKNVCLQFKGTNGLNAILVNPQTGRAFETLLANVELLEERRG